MLDINSITYDDLKAGKYEKDLPELYELKDVVEHHLPFHEHQPVFDHVIGVFRGIKTLLKLDFIDDSEKRNKIERRLDEKIGRHSRRELLMCSSLLHDITKGEVIKLKPDGSTSCPDHEKIAAEKVEIFKERFGWDEKDLDFVKILIKNHGIVHEAIDKILENPNKKKTVLNELKILTGDSYLESIFLKLADDIGLDLKRIDPSLFNLREKASKELILNEIEIWKRGTD